MAVTTILPAHAGGQSAVRQATAIPDRAARRILGTSLALGGVFAALFYKQALGLQVLFFVLGLVGALLALGRHADVRPVRGHLLLLAPLLFFAAMAGVRANGFLTFLNVSAVLVLLALLAYFYAGGRLAALGLLGYPLVLLLAGVHTVFGPSPRLAAVVAAETVPQARLALCLPVLRGLLLAAPVLLVFGGLLASADLVFAGYLAALLQLQFLPDVGDLLAQGLIGGAVAWTLANGFLYALIRRRMPEEQADRPGDLPPLALIGGAEVATVLVLVDGLFLVFGLIQFAYLFGGRTNIGLAGYTYADYARRGFFELVIVAVLALGLILGLQTLGRRAPGGPTRVFNGLASLTIGLVLVLLASAVQRMALYEAAYGYTELRLYVHVFMIWLAGALLWLLGALWVRPGRFALGAFLAALGYLGTLDAINPEATIVQQNLSHYTISGTLDTFYLLTLSEDSVPALVAGFDQMGAADRSRVRSFLRDELQTLAAGPHGASWPAFHLARRDAYDLLLRERVHLGLP